MTFYPSHWSESVDLTIPMMLPDRLQWQCISAGENEKNRNFTILNHLLGHWGLCRHPCAFMQSGVDFRVLLSALKEPWSLPTFCMWNFETNRQQDSISVFINDIKLGRHPLCRVLLIVWDQNLKGCICSPSSSVYWRARALRFTFGTYLFPKWHILLMWVQK